MPNNKYLPEALLIKGPLTILEAALKEVQGVLPLKCDTTNTAPYNGLVLDEVNNYWFTNKAEVKGNWNKTVLTLPQDWNTLMDILEGLKKPKVPEYVKSRGKVYKMVEDEDSSFYKVRNVYGREAWPTKEESTPITEEEFIQGGLKELEEAGFVKGARTKHSHKNTIGVVHYTVNYVDYLTEPQSDNWCSQSVDEEVKEKGFCFRVVFTNQNATPIGLLTLVPSLPTTSTGIPYLVKDSNVYMGVNDGESKTHIGTFKHWLKLGVTSITLPCGTLTSEDLKTIAGL